MMMTVMTVLLFQAFQTRGMTTSQIRLVVSKHYKRI